MSLAILGSRVLGLLREVVFAALFGAGAIADAYQVAFRIPNLLRDLLAEGALSNAFVPTFTAALRGEGEQPAHHLGNLVLSAILLVTGVLTGLGMLFAEPLVVLISDGFAGNAAKVGLSAELVRIMMPILALVSLGAVWMGMLNAQRRFVLPALAPAVFNLVSLSTGLVVWLGSGDLRWGIVVWSAGTVMAGVVQALMQLVALWRTGYRPRIHLKGVLGHPGVRRIAILMGPAVIGVAAVQISVFVNTRFAGSLGDGPVSELSYAFRLFFLPLGMFGVALATVTTTSVSEAAASGDRNELARRAARSIQAGLMLVSASAVGLWVLAEPVVTFIYRHGQTTAQDVQSISACLQGYVIGLLPYSLVKIFAPAFYAVDKPRLPLLASAVGVGVNVGFNALTYRELGAPGIALGTSLGAVANYVVLRLSFTRQIATLPSDGRGRQLATLLVSNGLLAAVVFGAWSGIALGLGQLAPLGDLARTALIGAGLALVIMLGFAVFTGVMRALDYPDADVLWSLPGRAFRRFRRRR